MDRDDRNSEESLALALGCKAWSSTSEPLLPLRLSDCIHQETWSASKCVSSSSNSFPSSSDEKKGKLVLSKEQCTLLEEKFNERSTLESKQKKVLAKQVNLRPRQVEVWFQNRRARTKLKKDKEDSEVLKRNCERLTHENRRLERELLGLRAINFSSRLSMCPSCLRIDAGHSKMTPKTPALQHVQHNSQTVGSLLKSGYPSSPG